MSDHLIHDGDEWYPVYALVEEGERTYDFLKYGHIDLSPEDHADYVRVMREFDKWQNRLAKASAVSSSAPPQSR